MKRLLGVTAWLMCIAFLMSYSLSYAQELKEIKLSAPQTDIGKPLMQVLKARCSNREFSTEKIPLQVLSNMLWAANGINRPDLGKRTAPSSRNIQETDIYVATEEGLFLYDAVQHILKTVLTEDIRALTGTQAFVKDAPLNLIYVADFSKMGDSPEDAKAVTSAYDTGFISQNVYLFCASEGLGTVVRGSVDRKALAEKMGLRPDQRITLSQSVGYPKK